MRRTIRATGNDSGSRSLLLRLGAALLLVAAFAQACGTGGGSSELAGILALVPADAENVEVYDFEQMRRDEPPEALRDDFEDLSGTGLDELGVVTDELTTLVFASGSDWYLVVVEGDIDFVHVRDQLEAAASEPEEYRGFELWEGGLDRHEAVALFEDRGRLVMGDAEAVRSMLRMLDRGSGSSLNDADSDVGRALRRAGEGWGSSAVEQCGLYELRGCRAVGFSARRGADDYLVEVTLAVLFRNERTAESELDELERQLEEDGSFEFDIDVVDLDGDFVVVTASADEGDLYRDEDDLSEEQDDLSAEEDSGPAPTAVAAPRDAPGARDDHGDSDGEATFVTVGDAVAGVVGHGGDVDYFAFAAERGETYRIDVELGTLDDSVAALFGPDLRELEFDDDGGESLGSRITWTAAESGTHYVGVAGWGSDTGSYTLTITVTAEAPGARTPDTPPPGTRDDHGDSAGEATFVALGDANPGALDRGGDVDYFAFAAERGETYRIEVELGTLDDSVALLLDPDLRELEFDDDGGESLGSRITWTAAESGTHYVGVAGWGSDTGSYTLTITVTADARSIQLTDNADEELGPAWSPDGGSIAFESDRDGDSEIYVMDADGSGVVQLTDNAADDWGPAWSPDGSRIAFASDRDGDSEIHVMDADGSGVVQLTDNSDGDWDPAWSPDGRSIAFASDRDGDSEIHVMDADGSGVIRLTDNFDDDWDPAWSPDGSRIALASNRDGDFEIYVMNADGSGVVQLTDNLGDDWVPAWSPDGSSIAFESNRDGDFELYVMNADGSGVVQLTDNFDDDWVPAWSPDGSRIAFASDRDGDFEIYVRAGDASIITTAGPSHAVGFAPYPGETSAGDGVTSGFGGSCTFNTLAARPHRSGDQVVAQGWWMVDADGECPRARVDVVLLGWWCDAEECGWRRIANGSSIVSPAGAGDRAVNAESTCISDETTGVQSVVDVDLIDWSDSAEVSVAIANVDCRPPDVQ